MSELLEMKLIKNLNNFSWKILVLMLVVACASTKGQNMLESGDPIVFYLRRSSADTYKIGPKINSAEEYHREVATPERIKRVVANGNSSETLKKNNSSEVYYFDYLVEDSQGNLHFHFQQKYENGTVQGSYGHGDAKTHYLVVSYVADTKGYRATTYKGEADSSFLVGLKAERKDGKINFSFFITKSLVASVNKLYTSGADSKSDEDDDSY